MYFTYIYIYICYKKYFCFILAIYIIVTSSCKDLIIFFYRNYHSYPMLAKRIRKVRVKHFSQTKRFERFMHRFTHRFTHRFHPCFRFAKKWYKNISCAIQDYTIVSSRKTWFLKLPLSLLTCHFAYLTCSFSTYHAS